MVSANHDRKYPCACCSALLTQLTGAEMQGGKADAALCCKEPQEQQGEARVAQPARASCSKFRQMCRKERRWSLILPAQTHSTWLLKKKFIPEFILPTLHPSSLLCLLKSKYFLGCSSEMNHRPISELPATILLLTQHFKAAVLADCSTKG